jgi:hypothetical protein
MGTSGIVLQRISSVAAAQSASVVDSEAPAGGTACRSRIGPLAYRYRGDVDPHWVGQTCEALDDRGSDSATRTVAFACGCHATVPAAALERAG